MSNGIDTILLLREAKARLDALSPAEKRERIRQLEADERANTITRLPEPRRERATAATIPCGGCGENNPEKRCIGCLHNFAATPASPAVAYQPSPYTAKQAVLAALRAAGEPLSLPLLVREAWRLNRMALGLLGFEQQYPCSRRVYATLCGANGLIRRGMVRKCGRDLYEAVA